MITSDLKLKKAPVNHEGARVSGHGGWFLRRLALHDPVLPLNIKAPSLEEAVKLGLAVSAAVAPRDCPLWPALLHEYCVLPIKVEPFSIFSTKTDPLPSHWELQLFSFCILNKGGVVIVSECVFPYFHDDQGWR
ncbi:hypothetical protein DsansV1_C16g0139041 [Dioscorea sansibarensis]